MSTTQKKTKNKKKICISLQAVDEFPRMSDEDKSNHTNDALNGNDFDHFNESDDDDDDDLDNNPSFAYQRLPDGDDDDDDDRDDDDDDDDKDDKDDIDDKDFERFVPDQQSSDQQITARLIEATPVMRIDDAIVEAEARMPSVLPDDQYANLTNRRGLLSENEAVLPPRSLDAPLSSDEVADVMSAMSELNFAYRPSWATDAASLAEIDAEVEKRTRNNNNNNSNDAP